MKEDNGINIHIPDSKFNVEFLRTNIRFNRDESIYKINVDKNVLRTLPDFLNNVKKVFQNFINVARIMSTSGKDKVRFYISKAPRTPFSTAILNVEDLNVEFFYNIFEKHMQSNAEEVLNHDWSSIVSVFVFPSGTVSNQKRNAAKNKQTRLYKYLKKDMLEVGSGNNPIKKHNREIRKGVFQIRSETLSKEVRGCCFPLALLVGKSFLDKDRISQRLTLNPNTALEQLYCGQDIYSMYKAANVGVGRH
jgi:hypothetical protein